MKAKIVFIIVVIMLLTIGCVKEANIETEQPIKQVQEMLCDIPLLRTYDDFNLYAFEHDDFDYKDEVSSLIEHIDYLNGKYSIDFDQTVNIIVHETQAEFDKYVTSEFLKGGMGFASNNELHILAPYSDNAFMTYSKFKEIFIHEYNHLYFGSLCENELPVRWFNEGLATYESPGYNKYTGSSVKEKIKQGMLSVTNLNEGNFFDYSGPATIVELIEIEYGTDTIVEIFKNEKSLNEIIELSDEALNSKWISYINTNY
ncbi:hypothetical protein EZV73_01835 [Acidaminobacter sp. JC074]|uniref:hypothetical protein n=1 Tax=Acidaminobacter sp. JC074 TaxID=2530199 RepID=UPI001F0F203E|nr:hypothetical protein [Acidaminobacter sp. JC074]MCH4886286.1 hypothetical protein [Acidaminobacter sp. JC074]